ncbi:hypothetical protein [Ruminiclostridium herbifermentans]|nr:hypothetical protein [Ruminiclostridium herbifermentans]
MFKCSKCGECCRDLDKSELYIDLDRGYVNTLMVIYVLYMMTGHCFAE